MTQIKFVSKEKEMIVGIMEELQVEKGILALKEVYIIEISNFIDKYNLEGSQLENLQGSINSIFTSKNRKEIDFYMLHARDFMKNIESAKDKGWI
ncbi:hypothetical protein [Virgibacillus sp. SK37]|uniref:hypothetical protein n=1 Tax=Virgibacillus sp. SK37 TaxID=403957 RepID=UPI0004D13DA5|nr:hypothetical protein [Virgibacillus sp. SK37]AIF45675.1 hypothetical protein X953_18985 [Virgibacillus sp. SK37]